MLLSFSHQAATYIQEKKPGFKPKMGLVLGSGLGGLADELTDRTVIAYTELPGFPESKVAGHAGKLVLGYLAGVPIACLQGRVHYYEGAAHEKIKTLVRTLKLIGCEILFATNAAGSLRPEVGPGEIMAISDHINFQGLNPLIGPNDEAFGPRFVSMDAVYDKGLRTKLQVAAKAEGFALSEGVYLATLGPMFETPAEIRAFRVLGADLVGMSTVSEVTVARHCGLSVVAVSAICNFAAGMSDEIISHEGTLHFAGLAASRMIQLIKGFLALI